MELVKLSAEYLKTANYALYHNRLPICQTLEVTNVSHQPIEDVKVTCSGEFISQYESELIGLINPDETVRINQFDISPDQSKLAALTERIVTDFKLSVTSKGETIHEENFDIELMPYDHWTGTKIMPQTIASFITPNHPAINNIVVQSAAMLKKMTGSSLLNEYQTGNSNDVRYQIAAVFAAVHDLGIVYRAVPASYEVIGQRITMPDQVISSKIGNCIELTLLMATVLEAIGINSIIIIQKGHAYLGAWLVNDCSPYSVYDDPSFIEKKCANGIDEMLVLECTHVAQENASFEDAVRSAEINLADHNLFEMFIDVKRCRLERILPLPSRIESNGKWEFESSGVEHDSCMIDLKEHDRYDLSRIITSKKELTKFDIWERKLLDFSLRNSLLNLSIRRRAVQFISFDIHLIEDHLQGENEYCILPKPNVDFHYDESENLNKSKLLKQLHELIRNDIEHHVLHTFLNESDTKNVLKNIYRAARNTIEETGANSLFLAIGTLRWFETDQSTTPRYAPLLLLPVEIIYKKGNYYIRTRDEEITLNITLIEFLRQNFDITIDGLNPLPLDDNGVDVQLIFAIVRDALKTQKRWDIEEECILGTFSFSKFLMWNDVHSHRDLLNENDIISSLVANRLTWTPNQMTSDLKTLDLSISPADTALPMPVDSSQIAAVHEGGNGNSFILYGPPGTGKSQTITNLIANALYHGKRVLFVAEKMAALSVVQSRLEKIGLDPFCLELHSNKSTKRHVLQQLEKSLKVVHIVPPSEFNTVAEKLFTQRKELIAYINALHTPDPADRLSLYDYILRYEAISENPLSGFVFDTNIDSLISREGVKGIEDFLGGRLETIIKLVGQPYRHPLNGLHTDRGMVMNLDSETQKMKDDFETLSSLSMNIESMHGAKELHDKLLRNNSPEILGEDPDSLNTEWRSAKAKWFIPQFFAKRKFIKRLRQFNKFIIPDEIDELIDDLTTYRNKHDKINTLNRIIKQYFNIDFKEDEVPEKSYVDESAAKIAQWANNSSEMKDWLHWSEYSDELRKNGLGCVVDIMEQSDQNVTTIKDSFLKALFKYKAENIIKRSETLATFEGMLFDEKTKAYKQLTEEFQSLTQKELYARLASRVPRMTDNTNSGGEIGLLNRNISNGGRGLSLRDLFDQLPTLLPRLCPCMLMSPMSVAQYIDLTSDKFDLVVFDEASQMPTSEAVGAIARGKSLIVVGDPKQMPPTSFFNSTNIDADEAYIDDMESILEDCRTLEMPSLQLSWHYRSRHESLIAFSNNEYYDGSLITFPSADDQCSKVHFIPVKGYYEKGGKRCNKAEAEAIVNEIERRLKDKQLRQYSIGVIAFSVMQQGLIEDILQDRLDKDKSLNEAASQMYEPIFVKNLENVQGDERDVILFSIGYGPNKEGKISMNFGPLNNPGGERRLNVAVSRARQEMFIFSTLKSSDIDLRRSKSRGVEGLKHFLQYAETKSLPSIIQTGTTHHNPVIATQIASELNKLGYKTATNVGRSHFRIDVAVENNQNPGTYSLGILLDGEGYRDTHTTRDREVVQPSVLNNLNWTVMRVWSVDWFNNKERVISRIIEKINENKNWKNHTTPAPVFDISNEPVQEKKTNAVKYEQFKAEDLTSTNNLTFLLLIQNIVAKEQPLTPATIFRRLNSLKDTFHFRPIYQKDIKQYLPRFYTDKSGAVWLSEEDSLNFSYYRTDSGRSIIDIPEKEIINTITETLAEQISLNIGDLTAVASKKLGFLHRGKNVDAAFRSAIDTMTESGLIETIGDNIRFKISV